MTLTLKFDLLIKNFNLGHSLLTRKGRAFIFSYVHSLWQDLSMDTKIFDLVTLTLKFDLLLKNFNLGHSFLTRRGRTFILHICIPYDKTFLFIQKILTLWPWPWSLTYFKKLSWTMTFESNLVAIYIWLPPASYVVFLTTLVKWLL